MTKDTSLQSLTTFKVTPVQNVHKKFDVEAVVIPRITCQLDPGATCSFSTSLETSE